MKLEQLMERLFEELEMGPLGEKDVIQKNPLTFALELDEGLLLSLKDGEPGVYMHAAVAKPPSEGIAELCQRLMEANLFGIETRGARLGMETESDVITLSYDMPEKRDYPAFKESVEDFTNVIHYWKEEIAKHSEKA